MRPNLIYDLWGKRPTFGQDDFIRRSRIPPLQPLKATLYANFVCYITFARRNDFAEDANSLPEGHMAINNKVLIGITEQEF